MQPVANWASHRGTRFSPENVRRAMYLLKERGAPGGGGPPGKLEPGTVPKIKRVRIRCPHCQWQPERGSRWMCRSNGDPPEYLAGGCGHVWNTFDTRGLCPGCQHQWKYTACLKCARWSLHEAWYEKEEKRVPD